MTEGYEIEITYQKYTSSQASSYTLRPYAVKEFAKRWYVIGYCLERDAVRVYGLDRVMSIDLTSNTFRMPPGFDVDELFATSFGIYIPEEKGRTIMFRTTRKEANFLRDLPIHSSQRELSIKEVRRHFPSVPPVTEDVYFEIFVCPNDALIMEFCKHGDRLEVLAPEPVRRSVATELMKAASQYEPYQPKP
jgi:predicted DNA-binding transcriptional regulator YafY